VVFGPSASPSGCSSPAGFNLIRIPPGVVIQRSEACFVVAFVLERSDFGRLAKTITSIGLGGRTVPFGPVAAAS
jgi:hypothetical protein